MRTEQNNTLLDELNLDMAPNVHFPRVIVYLLNAFFSILNVWLLLFGQEALWNWLGLALAIIFYSVIALLLSTGLFLAIILSLGLFYVLLMIIPWECMLPLRQLAKFCKEVVWQTLSIAWLTLALHLLTFVSILYIVLSEIPLSLPSLVI